MQSSQKQWQAVEAETPQGTAIVEYAGPAFLKPYFDKPDGLFDRVTKIQLNLLGSAAPDLDFADFKHLKAIKDDAWIGKTLTGPWSWEQIENDTTKSLKQAFSPCQLKLKGSKSDVVPTIEIDSSIACCSSK